MNDIIAKVTPETRGIIWFPLGEAAPTSPAYKAIDYLLNGLLTEGRQDQSGNSRVLISNNFNRPLYVFVVRELVKAEYESFLQLLKKDLADEHKVLVIDETEAYSALQKITPKEIAPHLQLCK